MAAKKRMDDWREADYRTQRGWQDFFTGIRFHCDMNPPECWQPDGWLTYAGIVIEISDRIPPGNW